MSDITKETVAAAHAACVDEAEAFHEESQVVLAKHFNTLAELSADTVTVCDKCLTASCWWGELMCEEAQNAGTVEMTVEELTKLHREHPSHWYHGELKEARDQ